MRIVMFGFWFHVVHKDLGDAAKAVGWTKRGWKKDNANRCVSVRAELLWVLLSSAAELQAPGGGSGSITGCRSVCFIYFIRYLLGSGIVDGQEI